MKNKLFIIILIIFMLSVTTINIYASEKLLIYSAAGLIKPLEEIAANFKDQYDIQLHLQFNGSGVLKNQIETVKKGDIYIAADSWYLKDLYKKNIVSSYDNIARHTPVIITPEGNPGNIKAFSDLFKPSKRIIVADPSAAIGRVTEEIWQKNNVVDRIKDNIVSKAETVNKVRMYVMMKQAEAGIVWKANYFESKDKLNLIKIPEDKNIIKKISMGILNFSNNKQTAKKFTGFVLNDKSKAVFKKYGYNINVEQVRP